MAREEENSHAPATRSADASARRQDDGDLTSKQDAVRISLRIPDQEMRPWERSSEEFLTCWSSLSESTDEETTRTTSESMFYIRLDGRVRRKVRSWSRGRFLGRGSFGMVFEGITNEGVFFAVKEVYLHDQGSYGDAQHCILQLQQEIALLSRLDHSNIVQYYGTDKEDSKLNIVHRDVKCANILVHANGSVKLADFGLAKEIGKFTALKSCQGSVYWMAPEVVSHKKTYGTPADIWSLGCTVLEMLTRQHPYPNLEWTQALFKIGREEPPDIPEYLSKEARDFISQCLRLNPDDRPYASKLLDHPFVNRSIRSIMSIMAS